MLTRIRANDLEVDQFAADLHRICGSFDVRPTDGSKRMRGHIQLESRAGIEVAHVGQDVQQVIRTPRAIRADRAGVGENQTIVFTTNTGDGVNLAEKAGGKFVKNVSQVAPWMPVSKMPTVSSGTCGVCESRRAP